MVGVAAVAMAAEGEGFFPGADGSDLFYRVVGSGPDTVVVVHGFQGNNQDYLAPDVARTLPGRALLFYDQRGGGRSASSSDSAPPGVREHGADLEALRRFFGFEKLRLLAHSGGAQIALQYGARYPERVETAVLVGPGPPASSSISQEARQRFFARLDSSQWARVQGLDAELRTAEDPEALCEEISSVLLPNAYVADPDVVAEMEGSFCTAPPEALRTEAARRAAFQASLQDTAWQAGLSQVEAPVLFVHGTEDAVPVAASEAWAERLPAASLALLGRADHLPWLDRPEAFGTVVSDFLEEGWVQPPGV